MSQIVDENGKPTIPSFYDDVEDVPQLERDMIKEIPFNEEAYKQAIEVKALSGEKDILLSSVIVVDPLLMCGIWVDILKKDQKQYYLLKHTLKSLAD